MMTSSRLEMYFQEIIQGVSTEQAEHEEIGLGFDAMLSQEVVKFLRIHAPVAKPSLPRRVFSHKTVFLLDEHELAMV
jgi:hypothetical protein